MFKKEKDKNFIQFIKFGMVGGINTILSLSIQWISIACGLYYQVGCILAYIITVFVSYLLNGNLVFNDEKRRFSFKALLKVYMSYSVTTLFLNSALLFFWNEIVHMNQMISPVLNLVVTIPVNFILNKYWAYR